MILTLQPTVLKWARHRASFRDAAALAARLKLPAQVVEGWEETGKLTMTQMQKLATATSTPEGMLFLPKPPQDLIIIHSIVAMTLPHSRDTETGRH